MQKRGFDELKKASAYYQHTKKNFDLNREHLKDPEDLRQVLFDAYDHLLKAETSCNFYWGSRWVHHSFDDIEQVYFNLDKAMKAIEQAKPAAKQTVVTKETELSSSIKKPSFPQNLNQPKPKKKGKHRQQTRRN